MICLLLPRMAAASGFGVGNGCNGLVCNGNSSFEILDHYELTVNGGKLTLNDKLGDYVTILNDLFNRWQTVAPKRMELYRQWLKEFSYEAAYITGISIPPTGDTGFVAIPANCELKGFAFQRPDHELFPGVKRYVINKTYWDRLSEVQKAGLVLHELIYREGIKLSHKTSYPTRYFNGYLSSATPKSETYASIASSMPLEWVEYGGGFVLDLKNGAFVSSRGEITYVPGKDSLKEIVGNVIDSDRLKIEFSDVGTMVERSVTLGDTRFWLQNKYSRSKGFSIKKLSVNLGNAKIEANMALNDLREISVRSDCLLKVNPYGNTAVPSFTELTVDPKNSWYQQKDGTVITGIQSLKGGYSEYGETFVTSTGDIWVGDNGTCMYRRKN